MQRKYKLKKYAISLKGAELRGVDVPCSCPCPDMSIIFHNANKAEAGDVVVGRKCMNLLMSGKSSLPAWWHVLADHREGGIKGEGSNGGNKNRAKESKAAI